MPTFPKVKVDQKNVLVSVGGIPVSLTEQELKFVMILASQKGVVCTTSMLLRGLYSMQAAAGQKIIDVLACKIRQKLERLAPGAGEYLRTAWGRGYVWGKPKRKKKVPAPHFPNPERWVTSHKTAVVTALMSKRVTEAEVLQNYPDMSMEELSEWKKLFCKHGQRGLRTTRAEMYL